MNFIKVRWSLWTWGVDLWNMETIFVLYFPHWRSLSKGANDCNGIRWVNSSTELKSKDLSEIFFFSIWHCIFLLQIFLNIQTNLLKQLRHMFNSWFPWNQKRCDLVDRPNTNIYHQAQHAGLISCLVPKQFYGSFIVRHPG